MDYMRLGETYSTGVSSIDEEHGELMDLINQIHEGLHASVSQDDIKRLLQRLAACAAAHFAHEEKQFTMIGYPDAAFHTHTHQHFMIVLSCFEKGTDRMGRPVALADQVDFLRDWLLDHITNEDQQVVDYLDARRAAAA